MIFTLDIVSICAKGLNAVAFGNSKLWHLLSTNAVVFGNSKLCHPLSTKSLSVTSQMLWPFSTANCVMLFPWRASQWPLKCCGLWQQQSVTASVHEEPLSDLSNAVAFGNSKLWHPHSTKSLSVTSQMLWSSATASCGILYPRRASQWPLKCYGLLQQQTMASSVHEEPLSDLSNAVNP